MNIEIDEQSLECLDSLNGAYIAWIAGLRYPGVVGYSEVRVGDASGATLSLTLRIADVDDELEVCIPVVKRAQRFESAMKVDLFEVSEFRVATVYRLQRRESIVPLRDTSGSYEGTNPREHTLSEIDDGDSSGTAIVDAGIALVSRDGLSLELYADSFPLVFQLKLGVASSVVPDPRRIRLFSTTK